jgi:hypothetical protein
MGPMGAYGYVDAWHRTRYTGRDFLVIHTSAEFHEMHVDRRGYEDRVVRV